MVDIGGRIWVDLCARMGRMAVDECNMFGLLKSRRGMGSEEYWEFRSDFRLNVSACRVIGKTVA